MNNEPTVTVGVLDRQPEIAGRLNGNFLGDGLGAMSGKFFAKAEAGTIILTDEQNREIARSPVIRFSALEDSTFTLSNVTIGVSFHWERREDQTFQGDLILWHRDDGTIAAINEIHLEDYLESVISSEMSSLAPPEFLRTHAILSRSWLLKALERKRGVKSPSSEVPEKISAAEDEVTRWYEQEDHDYFDVCADDHCQRYQGITKIVSPEAAKGVRETRGQVITYNKAICDARYAKACGGLTEDFQTAWDDTHIPYLKSISDGDMVHQPVTTEEEATRWILSEPEAFCNAKDSAILGTILPDFDRETKAFFRWTIDYSREELEEILREKSGIDFGTLERIEPLSRGPSGRIYRLRIVGSKKGVVIGKELEIRRWLSKSHLYSSAFVVKTEYDAHGGAERFMLSGAGWGHGVGLCQIGAAVMATRGFTAGEILRHYFPGTEIRTIY